MRKQILLSISFLISTWGVLAPLYSQTEDPGEKMQKIWSPYCKGVSLLECPSSKAEQLRSEIRQRMTAGEKFDQIFESLTERYGPSLRMAPETSGREGWAYRLPWIVFLSIAVGVIVYWTRRSRQRAAPSPSVRVVENSQIESQILKDLQDRINS